MTFSRKKHANKNNKGKKKRAEVCYVLILLRISLLITVLKTFKQGHLMYIKKPPDFIHNIITKWKMKQKFKKIGHTIWLKMEEVFDIMNRKLLKKNLYICLLNQGRKSQIPMKSFSYIYKITKSMYNDWKQGRVWHKEHEVIKKKPAYMFVKSRIE